MIYIYPANRMEDLLTLFANIRQFKPLPILQKEVVVVQSQGLQHWLNMELAKVNKISMNCEFVLPAQYLWKMLRTLCQDEFPEQTPYAREVLAWRIDALLQQQEVLDDPRCDAATAYWRNQQGNDALKRFQLAVKLADLYEQYLIYRPEWLTQWQNNHPAQVDDATLGFRTTEQWQSAIWQHLQQQSRYDVEQLLQLAIANIAELKHLLPSRISLFGINALAPMWLKFLNMLAEHIDVHIFHLNPCYEYWGDVATDKMKVKKAYLHKIGQWPTDIEATVDVNPLLANLGQQGREFLSLLHDFDNIEIPLYDELYEENQQDLSEQNTPNVLTCIQKDILTLTDRRQQPIIQHDDSIVITSAHSALREVQGLHDYLLHLFNDNPTLTPKDVIVMCPEVEQYAPYIDSVFVRGWEDIGDNVPPLPCSIADRISKESEPLVSAFSQLLTLPDSRYSATFIIDMLRLQHVQLQFGFSESDVDLIIGWLDIANIYWGLDGDHKASILGATEQTDSFTWQQGLTKLLHGFAYADEDTLRGNSICLQNVEGNDAIVLGKLMLFIEQLQRARQLFSGAHSPKEWHRILSEQVQRLFARTDNDNGLLIIEHALEQLYEYSEEAKYQQAVDIRIIRDFANHHFSQPDPGRQFMIGQITFCSMMPMRSIPFKVVAVLGLNDGEYPRQRTPVGFDLMAQAKAKAGDRSRRGDDRYLFLEALISARQYFYVSYQGKDVKNNNDRQPSVVLTELLDYLQYGYGWRVDQASPKGHLRQLPLQAFSVDNYRSDNRFASFDGNWLRLLQSDVHVHNGESTTLEDNGIEASLVEDGVDISALIAFYQHPSQYYARHQLKLFFQDNNNLINDVEPFQNNALQRYKYCQGVLDIALNHPHSDVVTQQQKTSKVDEFTRYSLLSGDLADDQRSIDDTHMWQQQMLAFGQSINQHIQAVAEQAMTLEQQQSMAMTTTVNVPDVGHIDLTGDVQWLDAHDKYIVVAYRHASVKGKDLIALYLRHLYACAVASAKPVYTFGYFFKQSKDGDEQVEIVQFAPTINCTERLTHLLTLFAKGQKTPLLLNPNIAADYMLKKGEYTDTVPAQSKFINDWVGNDFGYGSGYSKDVYINYFWPQCPDIDEVWPLLDEVYSPLFKDVRMQTIALAECSFSPWQAGE
ncbi:exodeoxyribonuclease V subunit gamma [Thalassotalea maritima]|uniref:exodeoxyribonuclease V subunit gamma n=1 Tax=Thalassotalea maritima TaxID=3242416 RepID=UPI003529476A